MDDFIFDEFEPDYSEYAFFKVTLEIVDKISRVKRKVTRGIQSSNGEFPKITDLLGLVRHDEGAGNCTVLKVEELSTREEYLKLIK